MRSHISRTATFAWSPSNIPNAEPLIVTGTLSGALDESFSNDSLLEIWKPNYGAGEEVQPIAKLVAGARFNRLAWGYVCEKYPLGVIAAGLENGELNLWDAKKVIDGITDGSASVLKNNQHSGPVKGLHFNPKQPNLLASGGVNGEIFIWDLSNPGKPYSPGARSSKLDEITALSWNGEVPHILATSSSSGYTVVWDLRNKKELTALAYGGGAGTAGGNVNGIAPGGALASGTRRGMGALCWHPEQPTRLATASDDDASPVVMLWDLRNSRAPEKVLSGHNGGILSLSWCKQDADLLLSCGKDNRTICWNPQSGQNVGELPASQNWSYDVQWCPKNPNLVAVASFDGRININSVQDTNQQEAPVDTSAAPTDVNDVFNSLPAQSEANNRGISLTQPPKWLKKPISATFAFGGQLVSTSNLPGEKGHTQSAVVHLRDVITEPSIASRAKRLQEAIDSQSLASFCAERSSDPSTRPDDVANWKALQTLFQADNRDELVTLLGFSKEDVAAKISSSIGEFKQTSAVTAPGLSAPGTPGLNGTSEAAILNDDITSTANAVIPGLEGDTNAEKTPPATAGLADVSAPASDIAEPPTAFNSEPNPFDTQQSSGGDAADLFNSLGSAPAKSAVPEHLFASAPTGTTASVAATAGSPRPSSIASESLRANTFRIYPDNESEFDKLVTRALVLGDFQSAVSLCLSTDRHADAILLAVRGGPELLARTQKAYFERKTASLPYLRLFQSIVSDDLTDIVQNADLNEWQEIFVVICTFAKRNEDFVNLAEQLGQRLEFQYTQAQNNASQKTFRKNAVLCYLAAGKLEKVASMWIDEMKEEEKALQHGQVNGTTTSAESTSLYSAHAEALQTFMEKIIVFQSAVNYVDVDLAQVATNEEMAAARSYKLAPLYDRILEYVDLLADQGLVAPALKYINQTPLDYHVGTENISSLARERLRFADQAKTGGQGAAAVTAAANNAASVFSVAATGAPVSTNSYAPATVNNTASYDPYGQNASTGYQSYGGNNTYDPYGQASTNAAPIPSAYAPPAQANVPSSLQQPIQSQSAYTPAQPLVAAPPPPVIGAADAQNSFAPQGAGPYGQQPAMTTAPPPPPPKKPDGGWNDIPTNLAPKRTTSAMSNRSAAQPITSPFPNAPTYNNTGSTPPVQPTYGGAQQGGGAVPPPPRGMQPPRGMISPPPGGAGGPYGRPGSGLGQPFAPQQRPPPQNAGPPPRGGTPGGIRPGPGGAHPQYQQPPQLQQQPQQAPSGPYAPAPGQVSVPPPPGPPGPGQQQTYGGPGGQQTPSQFGGAPQQQQGPPPPMGQGPGSGFARPPMPAIPPSGPPSNVPLRSTTPGAGAGAPPNRSATPAKPATKYPPGDRSHIPDNAKPILQTLTRELGRFKSITPPAQKRMADDVDKRVNMLLDLLNCGTLDARVVQALSGICQAIDARNQQAALSQYVQLASSTSGDVATALFGLKQVISKLNQ